MKSEGIEGNEEPKLWSAKPMSVKLEVPSVGESISEVVVVSWLKEESRRVAKDEAVVTLETDKVTVELPSPVDGVLEKILEGPGQTVPVGGALALIREVSADEQSEAESMTGDDGERAERALKEAGYKIAVEPQETEKRRTQRSART